MRRFHLFNFLEKKMTNAEFAAVISKVLQETAVRELALQIAVSYIANTLSKCEIKTYEKGEEVKGKLYYLLNVSPNHNENSSQFINNFIEKYYYEGEALIVENNDMLYCPDNYSVDESNPLKEFIYENITFGSTQLKKKIKAGDLFRIKLDNIKVRALVDALNDKYSELFGLAMQSYKRTNGKKYKLILNEYRAGDPGFIEDYNNVIKEQLKAFIENENAIYPEFKGTQLTEFSTATPMNSSDVVAMRKEIFEVTAQAFKLPLSMLLGNITNMNEIVKQYLSVCIDPLADMISEEFTRKYYTFEEWEKGYRIEVDTSCITHIDIFEVADKADKAISSGLASIDELRPRVKLNPLDTDFGRSHFMTKNYETAENVLKGEKGGESIE